MINFNLFKLVTSLSSKLLDMIYYGRNINFDNSNAFVFTLHEYQYQINLLLKEIFQMIQYSY